MPQRKVQHRHPHLDRNQARFLLLCLQQLGLGLLHLAFEYMQPVRPVGPQFGSQPAQRHRMAVRIQKSGVGLARRECIPQVAIISSAVDIPS